MPIEPECAACCHAAVHLVERDTLLQLLHDRLCEAAAGAGHVALVAGEAGIGKTSLLGALRARNGEVRIWWGACDAL